MMTTQQEEEYGTSLRFARTINECLEDDDDGDDDDEEEEDEWLNPKTLNSKF